MHRVFPDHDAPHVGDLNRNRGGPECQSSNDHVGSELQHELADFGIQNRRVVHCSLQPRQHHRFVFGAKGLLNRVTDGLILQELSNSQGVFPVGRVLDDAGRVLG